MKTNHLRGQSLVGPRLDKMWDFQDCLFYSVWRGKLVILGLIETTEGTVIMQFVSDLRSDAEKGPKIEVYSSKAFSLVKVP